MTVFSYPPGRWFVGDRTPDGKAMVHQDLNLEAWFKSKGLDWSESYGVTVIGSPWPWLVLVHRFATDGEGRLRRSRIWRDEPARRIPKVVRP